MKGEREGWMDGGIEGEHKRGMEGKNKKRWEKSMESVRKVRKGAIMWRSGDEAVIEEYEE